MLAPSYKFGVTFKFWLVLFFYQVAFLNTMDTQSHHPSPNAAITILKFVAYSLQSDVRVVLCECENPTLCSIFNNIVCAGPITSRYIVVSSRYEVSQRKAI